MLEITSTAPLEIEEKFYKLAGQIGEGAGGVVYLAKEIDQGNKGNVAVKMIRNYNDPIIKQTVDQEIQIQKSFAGNQHVIQYLGVQKKKNVVFIALELGEYTLRRCTQILRFGQKQLMAMLIDVIKGLISIHKRNVIHRDIKPENIIFKEGVFKITDFGISTNDVDDDSFVGTYPYLPPQMVIDMKNFTKKGDVWSLGVSAFQSYFKINPFIYEQIRSPKEVLQQIKRNIKALTPDFNLQKFIKHLHQKGLASDAEKVKKRYKQLKPQLLQLFAKFFQPNPQNRPRAQQFLNSSINIFGSLKVKGRKKPPTFEYDYGQTFEQLPDDIQLFCRTKNLCDEFNSEIQYSKYKDVIFALDLGIWFLQGRVYNIEERYVKLDDFKRIQAYSKKATKDKEVWNDIKTFLGTFFFFLYSEKEESNYFDKIQQLRICLLFCGAWRKISQAQDLCYLMKTIVKFEIHRMKDLIEIISLLSINQCKRIEDELLRHYYYQ